MHETTRQNNILDLVISTEEELIVNLKITDKIGDHQAITFSIKTEKGNIASEKNNYIQPIIRNNAELGFDILKSRVNDASRRHIPKDEPPSTTHCGLTMMSNRLLEGSREHMKQKEGSTMEKLFQNT